MHRVFSYHQHGTVFRHTLNFVQCIQMYSTNRQVLYTTNSESGHAHASLAAAAVARDGRHRLGVCVPYTYVRRRDVRGRHRRGGGSGCVPGTGRIDGCAGARRRHGARAEAPWVRRGCLLRSLLHGWAARQSTPPVRLDPATAYNGIRSSPTAAQLRMHASTKCIP
eukprot:COSAG02_NODE_7033_length_3217_cov_9.411339_1_plen_166_part_00